MAAIKILAKLNANTPVLNRIAPAPMFARPLVGAPAGVLAFGVN